VRFAQARDVGPYLYAKLSENRLISLAPAGVEPGLKKIYFANAALNISIRQQLAEILKALNEAGIPVIPLKGVYLSAKIYKNPADRTMVDLDILVREEDILETVQVMRLLDETPYHFLGSSSHHLPRFENRACSCRSKFMAPGNAEEMDSIDNTHLGER
jgi:hypothetical protein